MHRRILSLAFIGFLAIIIINWSCTKLDTTNLGSDLLPAVDNVNTFADTFAVFADQHDFDRITYVLNTDNQALGNVNFDPLFGKTTANVFLQLKPAAFPFSFGSPDSLAGLGLDSVVLCLNYRFFWGDSTATQKLQVYEVTDASFKDSVNMLWDNNTQPFVGSTLASPKDIDVRRMGDYMKYRYINDSVKNQIRIKLDASYAARLFNSDSTQTGTGNHAFFNDSIYRKNFNGFGIKAVGSGASNGLMYVNLTDTFTKLEVHYRIRNAGRIDTTYTSFKLRLNTTNTTTSAGTMITNKSSTANYINHDRSGTPSASPLANEIYLQAQPGTYANLSIPGLTGYSNRIIHRAELIVEQIPDNPFYDTTFSAPNFLYLDLKDSATTVPVKYKPLYKDLNQNTFYDPDFLLSPFYPSGGPDFSYFGGFIRKKTGPLGGSINYYNFNITRYVQQMVTKQSRNYEMRMWPAHSFNYPQFDAGYKYYNNNVAYGRIKVGNGNNTTYPMRVRIIYSNIK